MGVGRDRDGKKERERGELKISIKNDVQEYNIYIL